MRYLVVADFLLSEGRDMNSVVALHDLVVVGGVVGIIWRRHLLELYQLYNDASAHKLSTVDHVGR